MARVGLGSNKYSMGAFLGGCILLGLVLCVPVFESLFDVAEREFSRPWLFKV